MSSARGLKASLALLALLSQFANLRGAYTAPLPQTARTSALSNTPSSSQISSTSASAAPTISSSSSRSTESVEPTSTAIRVIESPSSMSAQSTISTTTRTPTSANEPRPSGGAFPVCHEASGPFVPFCLPKNGSEVWVDSTYYVTWDADHYTINSTINIQLTYANTSGNAGPVGYGSPNVPNAYGYVTIGMKKEWLQGKSRNNLTLYIVELDPTTDRRADAIEGPTISLSKEPVQHFQPPPPTPVPNHLGLIIGLPVGLGSVFFVLCGLCICMRNHRIINIGNIMGRRGRGYGVGQSRIERLGGRRKTKGIRLGSIDRTKTRGVLRNQYMDEPAGSRQGSVMGHERVDNLGSLASNGWNESERTRGNVFRNEVQRLKSWR